MIEGIVCRAAIANRDVKKSIRPKTHLTAVVIPEGLRHFEHDAFRAKIGFVGVTRGHFEFADDATLGILLAVINVEELIRFESRMECQAEQAFLVFHEWSPVHDVEKLSCI